MKTRTELSSAVRFDELAVLVEVAEAGSLAAAARRMSVPKSTIGRAVARLERDLGTPLLRRSALRPKLTEAGQNLVVRAAPHIAALRDATVSVARAESEIRGHIRITAPADLAEVLLGPTIAAFTALHPSVSFELDATIRLVDLIGEGFDLALRVAQKTLAPSSLVARKLARLDLGLYASPNYLARSGTPKKPDDLVSHEHVLLLGRQGRGTIHLEGPRGVSRVLAKGHVSANDFYFLRASIAAGVGIGALPWYVAKSEIERARLVRVLGDHRLAGSSLYVVHPPMQPVPAKLKAFQRFLIERAPALLVEPR